MARAEYAIANCVNTGQIACHVCNAIELKLESKRASQSETGIRMEELRAFKNKINWKNSRNLTTFVYVHSFFMLSSPVDRAAAHVHFVPEPSTLCALQMCIRALHSITTQKHQRYVVLKSVTKLSPKPVLSKWAVHRFPFSLHRANYMQNVARCYRRKPRSPSERHTM